MSYAMIPLSGSTDGKPIAVAAAASPGTTIHTAQASATFHDLVELEATNTDTVERPLTLEIGGTLAANQKVFTVPPGETIALGVQLVRNSVVISAFSNSASKINIVGKAARQS